MWGALELAETYWDGTGDIAGTVARLAAPLSKNQPFKDTNHRTAHTIAHRFLTANGYHYMAPANDVQLEEILARDRDPWCLLQSQIDALSSLFSVRMGTGGGGNGSTAQ